MAFKGLSEKDGPFVLTTVLNRVYNYGIGTGNFSFIENAFANFSMYLSGVHDEHTGKHKNLQIRGINETVSTLL